MDWRQASLSYKLMQSALSAGRRARVVRNKKGQGVFELRAKPDSSEMDSLNVNETGETCYCAAIPLDCP